MTYGPGFFNHSGCLYLYMEGGSFEMITADEARVNETLEVDSIEFDRSKTKCVREKNPGRVSFSFKLSGNKKVSSVAIAMRVTPIDKYGYWAVSQANLTITRADIDRKRTFQLGLSTMYSAADHSYSCGRLKLETMYNRRKQENDTKVDPSATIALNKFQLQPFPELEHVIFAPSYDCSVWVTIPEIMGLILVLLVVAVTALGAVSLKRIDTNDFKFSKEGLLFTHTQMETSKRQ